MKFSISKEKLLKLIQPLSNIADKKQTLPVLANVLIVVENNEISMIGSDLEVELSVKEPLEGDVLSGQATAPARKLLDIARNFADNATITCELDGDKLILKSGKSRFALLTLPPIDFPAIHCGSPKMSITLPQKHLKSMLESTQFAMAQQDMRYYLNGLLFEADADGLRLIATDGHRMAVSKAPHIKLSMGDSLHVILPRKAVSELMRLLIDTEDAITLKFDENHVKIETNRFIFISKLIDGRFPDYRRVMPQGGNTVVELDRDEFKRGLQRAVILSSEKHRGVRLQLEEGSLRIYANNAEQEEAEEEITLSYGGDSFEVGFNAHYLLDILNVMPQGDIKVTLQDPSCSALVQGAVPHPVHDSVYVIMPLRL